MKANLLSERSNLLNDFPEESQVHQFLGTHNLWTERTLKIADITDFNVNFLKPAMGTCCYHLGNLPQIEPEITPYPGADLMISHSNYTRNILTPDFWTFYKLFKLHGTSYISSHFRKGKDR